MSDQPSQPEQSGTPSAPETFTYKGVEYDDACEARAHEMRDALARYGVESFVHWDRSPWGVRIPLAPSPRPDGEDIYYQPSLFVLTEGTESLGPRMDNTWVWIGTLGNFSGEDNDDTLSDTVLRWHERHWLSHGVDVVARSIAQFVLVLRHGAPQSLPLVRTFLDAPEG